MLRKKQALNFILILILLVGCSNPSHSTVSTRPPATAIQATASQVPSMTPAPIAENISASAPNAAPSPSPTPAAVSVLPATVWTRDPLVPGLLYHRFLPLGATNESFTKIALTTFRAELQMLYDADFTLVPLAAWLKGDLRVPPGRRPLIFTMDDLFFSDQIFLDPDGTPSERSGLGILWKFSQEHPDFGFSAAIFYNLGDKFYGNKQVGNWFNADTGWQDALARAIAWCIEHGAMPYNHFYTHPQLILMEPRDVTYQLKQNEVQLQKLLAQIGKEELASRPENLIALPYSLWPDSRGSRQAILDYQSIYGQPVLGVMEADPYMAPAYLIKAPYAEGFSPYHVQRIGTSMAVIKDLLRHIDLMPKAQECILQTDPSRAQADTLYLSGAIRAAVATGRCPGGVYAVAGKLFRANGQTIDPLVLQQPQAH